jgi:uncharacterized protein (DUF2062 family)
MFRLLWRWWYRLIVLRSSPHRIAAGFALGVFIGLTPTFGLQMLMAGVLATMLRVNPIAALVSVHVTNWVTFIPIYAFNYEVGHLIVGGQMEMDFAQVRGLSAGEAAKVMMAGSMRFLSILWLGSVVVGLPSSALSYALMRRLIRISHDWRARRRVRRLAKRIHRVAPETTEEPAGR